MIKIAHRGNVFGPSIQENQPAHLLKAIGMGFNVEADVWRIGDRLWLGHSSAQYLLNRELLNRLIPYTWFHCKNLDALEYFSNRPQLDANYFWHENDRYTVTSHGYIWAYPGMPGGKNTIILDLNGELDHSGDEVLGWCSDFVGRDIP